MSTKKKATKKRSTTTAKIAKKATKKAPAGRAKKTTKKITKKSSGAQKMALVCANGEQCFWTTDGQVISNIIELSESLERMTDEAFSYHVNEEKNDFATWIEDVLSDERLATSLRKVSSRPEAYKVVVRRMRVYDC